MDMFPVKSRVVRSWDALQAAFNQLSTSGAWFQINPEGQGRYRIKVKPEHEHLLPPLKNWEGATDYELRQLACDKLPGEFDDWNTGEAIVRDEREVEIVNRGDGGFIIRTEVWVCYPENEA